MHITEADTYARARMYFISFLLRNLCLNIYNYNYVRTDNIYFTTIIIVFMQHYTKLETKKQLVGVMHVRVNCKLTIFDYIQEFIINIMCSDS